MTNVIRKLRRDERGMSLVFVGLGFMGFLAATMLAIDVGMMMNARSQAQNAADAAAHAGAVSLAYDDFDDKSASGPAVQAALSAGQTAANNVMGATVSITASDVTFPQPNWVRANVFRTGARGNPVTTLMASYFGISNFDINATATAEAAPSNAETCVKPFTIPDKWIEMQTPPWDPDDTFDMYDNGGNPLANPDVYNDVYSSQYTGYDMELDKGLQLTLKASNDTKIFSSFYYALAITDSGGGNDYRWNIGNCNTTIYYYGDPMVPEPGNMVGPTKQGIEDLIAKDPDAYWDTGCNCVHSDMHPSPRVAVIPVFDPPFYETGKQNGRNADLKMANWVGFYIEGMVGNEVKGRITPVGGLIDGGAGPAPNGAFPLTIRIVE